MVYIYLKITFYEYFLIITYEPVCVYSVVFFQVSSSILQILLDTGLK